MVNLRCLLGFAVLNVVNAAARQSSCQQGRASLMGMCPPLELKEFRSSTVCLALHFGNVPVVPAGGWPMSHTNTQLCHTHTHTIFTHRLSHTIFRAQLFHTHLCIRRHLSHNFVTCHLSSTTLSHIHRCTYTSLSHTIFHTRL